MSHSLARPRRGFTLIEALMASGILLMVVVAVTSAITAGQQNAYEAQQTIAATLAGEELMGRIVKGSYNDLTTWNGHAEDVGELLDFNAGPLPSIFDMIGRDVQVTTELKSLASVGVNVRGRTVRVRAFNDRGRILADLACFVPEPQE